MDTGIIFYVVENLKCQKNDVAKFTMYPWTIFLLFFRF